MEREERERCAVYFRTFFRMLLKKVLSFDNKNIVDLATATKIHNVILRVYLRVNSKVNSSYDLFSFYNGSFISGSCGYLVGIFKNRR